MNRSEDGKTSQKAGTGTDALSDAELLARELADVKRLAAEPRVLPPMARPDREQVQLRRQAASESAPVDTGPEGSLENITPIAADARIEFHRPGLQLRQWQKLKQGAIAWQMGVDLHGVTRNEALQAVNRLIREAQEDQVNCLRIVHGKGHGSSGSTTIKAELNHWLRRHEQVLAFCSALPADGGAGALYVLLRRRRD